LRGERSCGLDRPPHAPGAESVAGVAAKPEQANVREWKIDAIRREIGVEQKPAFSGPPGHARRLLADGKRLTPMPNSGQQWPDEVAARLQELAVKGERLRVDPAPVELRCKEGRLG